MPQHASPEAFISFEGLGDATAEVEAARQPGPQDVAEPMELDEGLPAPAADGSSTLHFAPLGEHAPARAQPPPFDVAAQTPQGGSVALTAAGCCAVCVLQPPLSVCVVPLQDPARRHQCIAQSVHPAAPYHMLPLHGSKAVHRYSSKLSSLFFSWKCWCSYARHSRGSQQPDVGPLPLQEAVQTKLWLRLLWVESARQMHWGRLGHPALQPAIWRMCSAPC